MKKLPLTWMLPVLLLTTAWGQPTAQPSLGVAIPLVLNNSTVLLANDFLLNAQTILPAGTQLISCFEPPKPKDADVNMKEKKATLENTFSRKPSKLTSLSEEERQQNSAMMRAASERAFGETWTDATRFQVYFHQLPTERYWVAFLRPNQPKPEIGQIEHWDGMYLGAQDHAVVVLSVEPDSRASRAGIKAGDALLAVNDSPVADLESFRKTYRDAEKEVQTSGRRLALRLRAPDGTSRDTTLSVPRSLTSDPFGDALPAGQ